MNSHAMNESIVGTEISFNLDDSYNEINKQTKSKKSKSFAD